MGRSYYFNSDQFLDEMVVCCHEDLNLVRTYMTKMRGLPLVNINDPKSDDMGVIMGEMHDQGIIPVGTITQYDFHDQDSLYSYASSMVRFCLVEHTGGVVRKYTKGLTKNEAKHIHVPEIVENIIMDEWNHFKGELAVCKHTLKTLGYYLAESRNGAHIFNAIDTVKRVSEEVINIEPSILERHPMLYCDEPEYRARIKQELEYEQMRDEYYRQMSHD